MKHVYGALYFGRWIATIVILILVWIDERWPLALAVTILAINAELTVRALRRMMNFMLARATMPPPTGVPPNVRPATKNDG